MEKKKENTTMEKTIKVRFKETYMSSPVERTCINMTRQEVIDNTPKEYYFDWMTWLLNETGCISVWYDFIMTPEEVTDAQTATIAMLIQKKAIKISKTVQ